MGCCFKLSLLVIVIQTAFLFLLYLFVNEKLFATPDPESIIPQRKWFGPGEEAPKSKSIRPFKVWYD